MTSFPRLSAAEGWSSGNDVIEGFGGSRREPDYSGPFEIQAILIPQVI
jgi:hypothetical protein